MQTVIDSNVLEPGSAWQLRVAPHGAGSKVEMIVARRFGAALPAAWRMRSTVWVGSAYSAGCYAER